MNVLNMLIFSTSIADIAANIGYRQVLVQVLNTESVALYTFLCTMDPFYTLFSLLHE